MAADLGIIGMGAMGGRMALLFASKGYKVAIFNRTPQKSAQVVKDSRKDREVDETLIERYTDLRGFVKGLKPNPRKVFINVSHGSPVDQLLDQLLQLDLLEAGDIVADLGNEWYKETERRIDRLAKHGIEFLGIGVSGGYQSARHGPSMTAGGGTSQAAGYEKLRPLLESVAPPAQPLPGADVKSPCVAYFGPGGAGHYVKMIHNGIEQGMMGILAEAYGIMRDLLGLSHSEMAVEFGKWLQTPELKRNYLIEISVDIVQKRDEERQNNGYLLDKLSDRVLQDTDGSEGTGVWTVKEMAERHVPCPTIAASHLLRILSTNLESRMVVSAGPLSSERAALAPQANPVVQHFLPNAVYLGMLCSYLQGMDLLTRTAKEEKWWHPGFPLNALFSWKEGCIIRSEHILDLLQQVFPIMDRRSLAASDSEENLAQPSLVSNETIMKEIAAHLEALRVCVLAGISHELPVPTLAATLEYLDSMRKVGLPTSMMQAQLDCFGWHRYQRAHEDDCQAEASHHVEWMPF